MRVDARLLAAALALCLAEVAQAQPPAQPPPGAAPPPSSSSAPAASQPSHRRNGAADIVTQPARDVGVSKRDIPPALAAAAKDPYSLEGVRTCRQLARAVDELNEILGPDFQPGAKYQENRMAKLAQAGGKTVINSIIPFRSLVREVSGAAPADRRMRAALDAGFARRGYLRGVHATRRCKPALTQQVAAVAPPVKPR